jgi:hypothetical protein
MMVVVVVVGERDAELRIASVLDAEHRSIVGHDIALFLEHNLQLMAKERCLCAG